MFRIAEKIGGHTVEELREKLSFREINLWRAYFDVERANYSQTDALLAQLCSMFGTVSFKGFKKAPIDYLPLLKETQKQNKEDILTGFKLIANAVNENKKRLK